MKVSVIIPTYNSEKTIKQCLDAVFSSDFKENFEVIVVDDCSKDKTFKIIKEYPCIAIRLDKNSGPSKARNEGAKKAKADVLFFIDSDVIVNKNAIHEIYNSYNDDTYAVIGMYSKEPANKGFFYEYMALWKYYTWIYPNPPKYFSFFIASCGSIKKDIFFEFGGFNTRYRSADVEDYEFGYRIREKYKIHFNPNVQGKHYYPTFKSCAKNYYKRASQWFSLFLKQSSFDKGAASASRGASSVVGFIIPFFIVFAFFFPLLWIGVTVLNIIFVIINVRFYFLTFKEKGLWFMIKSIFTNLILSVFITSGVIKSVISCPFKK